MTTKNKKTAFYTALAKAPGLLKEYIKQYTQGQIDFPDELVEAFTQAQGDVRKIEQMCNNLKKSKEGAQIMKVAEQVYNAAQQEIDSEINNSTGLFKDGGKFQYLRKLSDGKTIPEETNPYKLARHDFKSDTLNVTPGYRIISQYFYPVYKNTNTGREFVNDFGSERGRVLYDSPTGRQEVYFNYPDNYISQDHGYMPVGTTKDQESAKKWFYKFLDWANPKDPDVQKVKAEKHSRGGGIRKPKLLEKLDDDMARIIKLEKSERIPWQFSTINPNDFDIDKVYKKGPRDFNDRIYMLPTMIELPEKRPIFIDNSRYKGFPNIPEYDAPPVKKSDDWQKLLDALKKKLN